ncbi:MAG: lysylphosphatidylglycerol synthase domain-containing protein [Bacteroidota bacterium]
MQQGTKKKIFLILKIFAGLALFYILASRLLKEFEQFDWELMRKKISSTTSILIFFVTVLLMLINWFLESIKWKTIISENLVKMNYFTAFKSVLSGVAFGNLAPGRATEFAGKIIFIPSEHRGTATYLHFVNGIIQLLITIVVGIFSIFLMINSNPSFKSGFSVYALSASFVLILLIGALLYKPSWFYSVLQKNKTIKKHLAEKIQLSSVTLLKLTAYSILRYIVFSLQFYFLILVFFDTTPLMEVCLGIGVYYLLTTIIPMFSAIEAFMRGGIAVLVFTQAEPSTVNILSASTFLWIINIVIPSVIGYLFFLFLRNSGKTNNEYD